MEQIKITCDVCGREYHFTNDPKLKDDIDAQIKKEKVIASYYNRYIDSESPSPFDDPIDLSQKVLKDGFKIIDVCTGCQIQLSLAMVKEIDNIKREIKLHKEN